MNYGTPFRKLIFCLSVTALVVFPICVNGQESVATEDDKSIVGEIVSESGQPTFEEEASTEEVASSDELIVDETAGKVMLKKDGTLTGTVFVLKDEEKQPINAKVSLSSDGVIIDSVKADETGTFSFDNVEPGSYDMFATADNMVASQAVEVMPYADGGFVDGGSVSYTHLTLPTICSV